jgi:amino acid adenylation domain-containing protein
MRQQFVHEMFQEAAAENPAQPAVASADRELTYAELNDWSNHIGNYLIDLGAVKGSIIFIAVESSFSVIASMIATLKIGGVFVPVDPHQPEGRLRGLAAQVPPAFVLTEQRLLATIGEKLGVQVPVVPIDATDPVEGCLSPPSVSEPEDMCYVYFTSGSTGQPKAIAGRLKSIDHFVRWEIGAFAVKTGTVVSQLTSPVFDAFLRDTFTPLCAGGTLRVPDSREAVLDPKRLGQWLHDSQVEIVHSVPSLFRTLLAEGLTPDHFPALRYVALAGEPLLPADVRRWMEIFGDRIRLVNLYGPTETTMVKLFYMVRREDSTRRSIPVGQAMPGARALVLDEAGRPAAEGAIGEIYIRTPYRTLGYYNNPELTQQVFVPNPLSDDPADIVYRTGDLGRLLDDGNIEFLGRKDQQVKVRGVRVELEEIENAILATGMVKEAATVSRADRLGNSYLCAYIVTSDHASVDEVRHAVAANLPDYMVPSTFLELERLPRTATGKIDRKSLPAPEQARSGADQPIEPRNQMEAEVATLFAEVLGLERVGINEDFFQLGGHSLLAMSLLSRLSAQFEVDLPLATLFEFPTVEQIAHDIEQRRSEAPVEGAESGSLSLKAAASADFQNRVNELSDAEVDSLLADILKTE